MSAASPSYASPAADGLANASTIRHALGGFFLSGLLMSFLGAILPAWGYHLHSDYLAVGHCFLALNAGLLFSVPLQRLLLESRSQRFALVLSCALAAGAFFYLAAAAPPAALIYRLLGLFWVGIAGGWLNATLFARLSPLYRRDPAATVNLCGLAFGSGSLATALLVSGTFYVYTISAILVFLGLFPAFLAIHYARSDPQHDFKPEHVPIRQAWSDFRSPAAILFALLLFFQFGNEWAIAGWLPLFLAQRLGISPATSLLLLGLYWASLMIGRVGVQAVLPFLSHGKLLLASVVSAMFGCIGITFTENLFGAATATLLIGAGFAPVYPLVVERIGRRFPYYHPGLFNGLFSFAVTGGLLAAASLGYWAEWLGIGVVMALPMFGSVAVFLLLAVIWLESHLAQSA